MAYSRIEDCKKAIKKMRQRVIIYEKNGRVQEANKLKRKIEGRKVA